MLVVVRNINLTNPAHRSILIDFCERSHFQAPIPGNPVDSRKIHIHGKLTGKDIPETVKESQEWLATKYLLQGL